MEEEPPQDEGLSVWLWTLEELTFLDTNTNVNAGAGALFFYLSSLIDSMTS